MKILAFIACLLVVGCQAQPHHQAAGPELRQLLREAVVRCFDGMELTAEQRPSERLLDREVEALALHARDAGPLAKAAADSEISDEELRDQAWRAVAELRGLGRDLPERHLLSYLLDETTRLDPGMRVLLVAAMTRLIAAERLDLSPGPR